jgi:DNA-binding SARP family transcriptional activator
MLFDQNIPFNPSRVDTQFPITIYLLGRFSLLKKGQPVAIHSGSKTESLLCNLALRQGYCLRRDTLLNTLWPNIETTLAGQSLNSLVYSLNKRLGDGIGGAAAILWSEGTYRLNVEAGVGVDVQAFDDLALAGDRNAETGNHAFAITLYMRAAEIYRGDLVVGNDLHAVIERERLRARYLTLLAYLADFYYGQASYVTCLGYALRLLAIEPCREDAHRVVMRCYVRRGERAQALRQYRLCERILRTEFDAAPEPSTLTLYDLIRHTPDNI